MNQCIPHKSVPIRLPANDILMSKAICSHPDIADFQHDVDLGQKLVTLLWTQTNQNTCLSLTFKLNHACTSFYLNGIKLERVQYKYLGVWISENLSWEKHVEYICSKACRGILISNIFSLLYSPGPQLSLQGPGSSIIGLWLYRVGPPYLNIEKLMLEKIQLFATRMLHWCSELAKCFAVLKRHRQWSFLPLKMAV